MNSPRTFCLLTAPTDRNDRLGFGAMGLFSAIMTVFGLMSDTPRAILAGLDRIICESDILITDYVAIGGIGAAFVNAGLLMFVAVAMLRVLKTPFRGISVAAVFLMGSFGLFGKNIFNIWPIIAGTMLYSRMAREPFAHHVHTALFGTCLAPMVTEFVFILHLPNVIDVLLGVAVGICVGLVLPPLAAHMSWVHKGYSLYNIGFTAGIIGTVYISLLRSYGYVIGQKLVWSEGNDVVFAVFLGCLFFIMILLGVLSSPGAFAGLFRIWQQGGRFESDFIRDESLGASFVNMGVNGLVSTAYVLLVGGPLNGPTIGGILTVAGFGACGKHARNILPIYIGVFLGSLTKIWSINDPAVLLAALFGTCLAPIAGVYGWAWGILAGFLNSSVALCSSVLHGGMNLYNTGFSAGIVAAFLVPLIEQIRKKGADVDRETT